VTFRNRCAQELWPAWASTTGLDYTVIDPQVWLPIVPGNEHAVTAYSDVRELGFWGRTGCNFDPAGSGTCQTGDCGGFACTAGYRFPANATVFVLHRGFTDGYNVAMRVEGATCATHECVADVSACPQTATTVNACGAAVACDDICSDSPTQCCSRPDSGCEGQALGNAPDFADLVITFCP
jgi:hypothetical protein